MFNTIILRKGNAFLTNREYKTFEKGSTIWGPDIEGEEIKRWNIEDKDKALAELNKYVCEYRRMAEDWPSKSMLWNIADATKKGRLSMVPIMTLRKVFLMNKPAIKNKRIRDFFHFWH